MGVALLVLLVTLVPLANSRDLRTATKVNRRTAPDPLLVQLFNDPTATSLTKHVVDDTDGSASGSGLWTISGDEPKTSDDKTTETKITSPNSDTATAVELATDQSTATVDSGSGAESITQSPAQTTTPTKTEDETVETKDDSITNKDETAKKSPFIPAQTQTVTDQVEEGGNGVRDSTAAPKGKEMYDATIVKKDDVPRPDGVPRPDDVTASTKSVILPSSNQDSLAPLTTDMDAQQNDQPQQDVAQMAMQPQQDMPQPAMQPQPDMSQLAMQPQQDMPQPAMPQPAMQSQQDMSQLAMQPQQDQPQLGMPQPAMQPQQDMPQAPQQLAASLQGLNPGFQPQNNTFQDASMQAQPFADQLQDPSQQQAAYQDPNQVIPQATDQAMQAQGNIPVSPYNPYTDPSIAGQQVDPQTGMPIAGMHAVPVFQGLKPKNVNLKKDECEDMFDSCPQMAKTKYCTDYADLMETQCRKSCGFCKVKDESSASGSDDDSSASGSAMWDDEDNRLPVWKKSGIPSPGDKFVGESGSGSAVATDDWSTSGSAVATDDWSTSASGANMIKGDSEPVFDISAAKKEQTPEVVESGSGQQSEDIGSASGANLAEDLATGTVSRTEKKTKEVTAPKSKYSEIPVPRVIIQQQPAAQVYPRIDLKVIAKAVNAYKSTALRMLGEAIRDAAQEAENKAVKKTNIPMPPATEILEKMGFPMEEPRSEIPQYAAPGYPYAQYYQGYPNGQYNLQQDGIAKSDVQKPEEPKEDKEAEKEEESSAEEPKKEKKSDINDPYQYIRHMAKGASMQPIESSPGASLAPYDHSSPIILFKNSQMSNVAAKKNMVPKPSVPKFLMQQMPQALPAARSNVIQPQYDPNAAQPKTEVPTASYYNQNNNQQMQAEEGASQYQQDMPSSDNDLDSALDDVAMMRSESTSANQNAFFQQQQQGDDDANLRELRSFFPNKENKKKRNVKPKTAN